MGGTRIHIRESIMRLILASGSPRRKMLLKAAGYPIAAIQPARIPEQKDESETPLEYTTRLARQKSEAQKEPDSWVLGADTIVHVQNLVLEKPNSDEEAIEMLTRLSGGWHMVTTAWCLLGPRNKQPNRIEDSATSRVLFRSLEPAEIQAYVATGEGRDKAGSYGIQGLGAAIVAQVEGSYSNVVGLPMEQLTKALKVAGIHPTGMGSI